MAVGDARDLITRELRRAGLSRHAVDALVTRFAQLGVLDGQTVTLPTADPHVVGALWNSAGTMKISAG